MAHTREAMSQHLAERWYRQAAHRDDTRIARRLYRTHVGEGVCRWDEGALLDACLHFWQTLGLGGVAGARRQLRQPTGESCLCAGLSCSTG